MEIKDAVEWVQGFSNTLKAVVSAGLFLLFLVVVFLVWQKPAPAEKKEKGEENSGILNNNGTQIGSSTSTGQSGGVTAGVFIAQSPPVTEQEKQKALASLESELEELIEFPGSKLIPAASTLLEELTVNKLPRELYYILVKYYKDTIKSVPNVGNNLFIYKQSYYKFSKDEANFESMMLKKISSMVQVRYSPGWVIYLKYFILRAYGNTIDQVKDNGNFLNYGITWDDEEKAFTALIVNTEVLQSLETMKAENPSEKAVSVLDEYSKR